MGRVKSGPKWKFPRGCASSISKTFSQKMGSKAIQTGKWSGTLELVKTSKWNASFRLGISVYLSRNPVFPGEKIFVRGDEINLFIYILSEISRVFG